MSLDRLRQRARGATLGGSDTLAAAVAVMGFVQADPIRAPARAQDLILRHRVRGYQAGELERRFVALGLEEDFLHAYGFMPVPTMRLLHPRLDPQAPSGRHEPQGLAAEVLAFVRAEGPTHPRALEAAFGRMRAVNNWGGFSAATTRALEALHHYRLLRVARRRDGIRVYEAVDLLAPVGSASERTERLVMLVARLLAPVSAPSLRGALALMMRRNPGLATPGEAIAAALRTGALEPEIVDREAYLWPAGMAAAPARRDVRLLAPFDPIVWDRRRFAHLWGWEYRFEAYTPPGRRRFGYYAMPMLWHDRVIGWANVGMRQGRMTVETGFAEAAPRDAAFRRALDAELGRLECFLGVPAAEPTPA